MALVVSASEGLNVHICYVDEAGCTGAVPDAASPVQPVFVLAGIFLPHPCIKALTCEWITLKQRRFPGLLNGVAMPRFHDWMAAEVKGADLRKRAKHTSRNSRRFAIGVLNEVVTLLERHNARIAGRVFAKPVGGPFSGTAVYTSTAQLISTTFQHYLEHFDSDGLVIADSRNKAANASVSHSIFTQRHRAAGDPYPRIVEAPTFGHSDNHAGLQLADILCSGLLFPIAAQVCSAAHLTNHMHCDPYFLDLRERFGPRLRAMQWMCVGGSGQMSGGITLKDQVNGFKAPVLFSEPAAPLPVGALGAAMQGLRGTKLDKLCAGKPA